MKMKITLVIILAIFYSNCATNTVFDNINMFIQRHKNVYKIGNTEKQTCDSTLAKTIEYPRGDKQKLAQIAQSWSDYYECCSRMMSKLTPSKRLPSHILSVYEGYIAKLQCGLCVAPGELSKLMWKYAKSASNMTFNPLLEDDNIVHEANGDITIYHVEPTHAGVYRCEIGRSASGLIILDVVDDEEAYDVVKPRSSGGPYSKPPMALGKDLTLFTSWSSWSECSTCFKVGRKRRYGMCYVKVYDNEILKKDNLIPTTPRENIKLDLDTIGAFQDYPKGIPCRSVHLPQPIADLPAVEQRRNEIMIAMCKVQCTNNKRGRNSVPPYPMRKIQFEVHEEPIKIRCPGTTHRDIPVLWRIGTKAINPRILDENSNGRVHLNARDHLVFTKVLYSDANLYSCWQDDRLAGTVKLVVWGGDHSIWNQRTSLMVLLVATCMLLRYLDRLLYNRQR